MENFTDAEKQILADSCFGFPPEPLELNDDLSLAISTTKELVLLRRYFKEENPAISDEIKKRLNAQYGRELANE